MKILLVLACAIFVACSNSKMGPIEWAVVVFVVLLIIGLFSDKKK